MVKSSPNCEHTDRFATLVCGSYFVQCTACHATLITIPWYSVESLLRGQLTLSRTEGNRETLAEGPAEQLIPHIRQILACNERLALTGPYAVVTEDQLGSINNNPLEIQFLYYTELIREHPRDDSIPFALAQVLMELGEHEEAHRCYDKALALGKRNWYRKLSVFLLPSVIVAVVLWQQQFLPWLVGIVAAIGLLLWFMIFRNRQRWLPIAGFDQRAITAAQINMAEALKSKYPIKPPA